MCSAIAGSTTESARPWVTSSGTSSVAQHVVVVDLAGGEVGADPRRHGDVPAQRGLEVVGGQRLRDAGPHEGAHRPDVGRQVVGGGVGEVVEEAGADQRAERRLAQLDGALDEVDRRRSGPGRARARSRR